MCYINPVSKTHCINIEQQLLKSFIIKINVKYITVSLAMLHIILVKAEMCLL